MRIIASMMILIFLTASLSGCTAEEFCGDFAEFDNNLPIGSDQIISYAQEIKCPLSPLVATAAAAAVAGCWTVKTTAVLYDGVNTFCLGFHLGQCIDSTESNESYQGCEEFTESADVTKVLFMIHDKINAPKVGDIGNLTYFAPEYQIIEDDFSNATWDFYIDEEGFRYQFF